MSRRHVALFSLSALTLLILTQFQNCAPARSVQNATASSGGQVRLVEDLNKVEIQFATGELQVQDTVATVNIDGLCNRAHNGAKLRWTVWADNGAVLMTGESSCQSGQFELDMSGVDQLVCGVSHQLVVQGDWGGSAFTLMQRRCQPLASESVQPPEGSPIGTECELEYVAASDVQSQCNQVCYRQGQMMSQTALPVSECSNLAARLAGP